MELLLVLAIAAAAGWWIWHVTQEPATETVVRVDHHLFPEVTERIVEDDAFEGSFWEVEDPIAVRAHLHIHYVDANRQRTERTIHVHRFGEFGSTALVIAHCALRDSMRTFRTDRIETCTDAETGRTVDDVAQYLREKHAAAPESTPDKLSDEEYDALRVLLYLGQSSGLDDSEKTIIRDACRKLAGESQMSAERIDQLYRELDAPTIRAFQLAAGRVSGRSPERRIALMVAAKRIVAGQTAAQPVAQQALAYLQQRLFNTRPEATASG